MPSPLRRLEPTACVEIELTSPLPVFELPYSRAQVLIRLDGNPLGLLHTSLEDNSLHPEQLADEIWQAFAPEITNTYIQQGFDAPETLPLAGLPALSPREPLQSPLPTASVVIATRNRTEELRHCLQSLRQLKYPSFEILVVDNAPSSNHTKTLVEEEFSDFAPLRYLHIPQQGTSRARNLGIAHSHGEIIAFTDDDTVVDPHWLQELVSRFLREPEVECVTGLVLPGALDTLAQHLFEEYGGFGKGFAPTTFRHKMPVPIGGGLYPYSPGVFGSGNSMAFRRYSLEALGGFDSRLGGGTPVRTGEDLDLFLSLILRQGSIAYEPRAIVYHFHRADFESLRRQLREYGMGMSAILTKWTLRNPRHLVAILRRLPTGIRTLFVSSSRKNAAKTTNFPASLTRAELFGLLLGPFAYLRSRTRHTP